MGQREIVEVMTAEFEKNPSAFHTASYIAKASQMNISNCIRTIKKLLSSGVLLRDVPCSWRVKVQLNPLYYEQQNKHSEESTATRNESNSSYTN